MADHINFHSLSADERRRFTRAFTDPALGDRECVLTFEQPDASTDYLAAEIAELLVRRYITGDEALGMPPQPFLVGQAPRKITPRMCEDAGLIVAMQPEPPEYQPEEVLQMAFKARDLWREVRRWALSIYRGSEDDLPNASTGDGAGSSAPRSTPDTSIPEWSNTSAAASGS